MQSTKMFLWNEGAGMKCGIEAAGPELVGEATWTSCTKLKIYWSTRELSPIDMIGWEKVGQMTWGK